MNLFGVMDISGSALSAERIRAEVTAANMANSETTKTEDGGPYQRQEVVFETASSQPSFASFLPKGQTAVAGGVQVSDVIPDATAVVRRYDPGHPDADAEGYVNYPDINPATEMVDILGATRAYGLNVSALQAEKGMLTASLEILK